MVALLKNLPDQLGIWAGPVSDPRVIEGLEGIEHGVCFPGLFSRPPSGPLELSPILMGTFQADLRDKKLRA